VCKVPHTAGVWGGRSCRAGVGAWGGVGGGGGVPSGGVGGWWWFCFCSSPLLHTPPTYQQQLHQHTPLNPRVPATPTGCWLLLTLLKNGVGGGGPLFLILFYFFGLEGVYRGRNKIKGIEAKVRVPGWRGGGWGGIQTTNQKPNTTQKQKNNLEKPKHKKKPIHKYNKNTQQSEK